MLTDLSDSFSRTCKPEVTVTPTKKAIVFLQARVSSTRLPGKVLLPINGLPLVVLAARRAGNTGRQVTVVTSTEQSDDVLCETLVENDVEFFRGDLNNVLSRYADASRTLAVEDMFFRLTADNVFPDGDFLDRMEAQFRESKCDYMACSNPESGMPFGVSAEITSVEKLRQAATNASDAYDIEHVTPYIKRHSKIELYKDKFASAELSNLRCTVDTQDDYNQLEALFRTLDDPVGVSLRSLLELLADQEQTCFD